MRLEIKRFKNVFDGTLGRLSIFADNGKELFSCYTLEPRGDDEVRPGLDKRVPQGQYSLRWHDSPRFKRRLLHIYNRQVPQERYILFHIGNYPKDTEGCILLGETCTDKGVLNSRAAFNSFMAIMLKADLKKSKLNIINQMA